MSQLSFDFFNLFVESPGDFIYFLVVIVLSQASLFMVLGQPATGRLGPFLKRYRLALAGVVVAWVALVIAALYAMLMNQNPVALLPPLERAAGVVTILLLGWAFFKEDEERFHGVDHTLLMGLLLVTVLSSIFTLLQWQTLVTTTDFNLSGFGIAWAFIPAIFSVLGVIVSIITFRHVLDAPLKIVFFFILFAGHAVTLYQMVQGNIIGHYAGAARWGLTLAMLIVPVLVYRLVIAQMSHLLQAAHQPHSSGPSPAGQALLRGEQRAANGVSRSVTTQPKTSPIDAQPVQLLKTLGMILDASSPAEIPQHIVYAAVDLLRVDIGALLRWQDANYADVTSSYDRVMTRSLPPMSLNLESQPTLANAIERRAQRALYPDRNADELNDLFTRLNIEQIGPVYFQPLTRNQELVAVLMVGLPYATRELSRSEIELLTGIGILSASLLSFAYDVQEASAVAEERVIQAMVEGVPLNQVDPGEATSARRDLHASLDLARQQVAELSKQVLELKRKLSDERKNLLELLGDESQDLSISQSIKAVNEQQAALREDRDRLMKRLQEAEAALSNATAADNETVVNNLVQALRSEKQALEQERDHLLRQLGEMRDVSTDGMSDDHHQLLNRMIEEKTRLEVERNQLNDRLSSIQTQLQELGLDDGITGLSQLIGHLYEERADLREKIESLQSERDGLLRERMKLADAITREQERDERLQALSAQIEHISADREAALKQRDKLRRELDDIKMTLDNLKGHRGQLLKQIADLETRLEQADAQQTRLRDHVHELNETRHQLFGEMEKLERDKHMVEARLKQLEKGDQTDPRFEIMDRMIRKLTRERSELQQQLEIVKLDLAQAQQARDETGTVSGQHDWTEEIEPYQPENPDLLMSLVQEFRTPMTSITGYVDLLLGESTGILGEMQRRFLQRVATNIQRLEGMIEDLIQVMRLDLGQFTLERRPVNIVAIIEDAITNASIQFREKELAVNLDLQEGLPTLPADYDAMTQIIGQLLTNAYLVSPPQTAISVSARMDARKLSVNGHTGGLVDCIHVAIEDRGGGIAEEEIPRVFARKYKTENPLIMGLGDTGVGLSIARALVKAHHGQLWVDVKPGSGSVFNFAVPVDATFSESE